mgnify:CR=1 FL=1
MYDNLDLGLINKVAIVAGGGSANEEIGNGRAAAILLAEAGCKVLVVDKNEKSANQTVDIIKEITKKNIDCFDINCSNHKEIKDCLSKYQEIEAIFHFADFCGHC